MARGWRRWFRGLVARGGAADEQWLPVDDLHNGYYNYRLMRFRADGDLVRYPDYIWSSAGYWAARGGLSVHLEEVAERLDGAIYSDVMVLLNREDRRRCLERLVRPWEEQLQALVDRQIHRLVEERGWRLLTPDRPIRIRVVGDGEAAMGGRPIGLQEGEFATVLLPNLYLGPARSSRPFAEVFIRVPREAGGPGGFRSVGTFFDDQLAFTIGRHWLDNGRHEALPASALYTLHRYPGTDGVNHRLNADLADVYQIEHTRTDQGDTVTIREVSSEIPVLEVMLIPAQVQRASRADPPAAAPGSSTLIPDEGLAAAAASGMTMIPEPEPEPAVVLSRRAVLLQKIHFGGVMRGYHLAIENDGSVAPLSPAPAATLRVEEDQVYLEPIRRDVTLDGQPLQVGRRVALTGLEHRIAFGNVTLTYNRSARAPDQRWPYLGQVTVPAEPIELAMGACYRIGRDRRKCEIALPDRAVNENILWHPSVRRDGAIRTRTGEVPVESFTTDSIMVAGIHAEVDLRGSEPKVRALSKVCPVFLRRRDGSLLRLVGRDGATAQPLALGDDLLVGNTLFRVILPGAAATRAALEVGGHAPTMSIQGDPRDTVDPARLDTPLASARAATPGPTSPYDPPEAEIAGPEDAPALQELPTPGASPGASGPQVTAPVVVAAPPARPPASPTPAGPPPPAPYGDLPRNLRARTRLPDLDPESSAIEEGLTVVEE